MPEEGSVYSSQNELKRETKKLAVHKATIENLTRQRQGHWVHASLGKDRPVITRPVMTRRGVDLTIQVYSKMNANLLGGAKRYPEITVIWNEDADIKQIPWIASRAALEQASEYDIVGYMEDDILIEDLHFFEKLALLGTQFESSYAFVPHRCEHIDGEGDVILSGDPDGGRNDLFWDTGEKVYVDWPLGPVEFYRATNPHSGCYFLTRKQALVVKAYWKARQWLPDFQLSGPLEQAASGVLLPVMKVMKPIPSDYRFLMVRHQDSLWKRHPLES